MFFFLASLLALTTTGTCAWLLAEAFQRSLGPVPPIAIPAFGLSTVLLALGSWTLEHACTLVRRERQQPFRWFLLAGLFIGMSFVVLQILGLWAMLLQPEIVDRYALKSGAFAFVAMHGMHFVVALLFLVYVLLLACADRYDHEYSWGVVYCTWFWHGLGIAWVAIVAAFLIAFSVPPSPPELEPENINATAIRPTWSE